MSKSKTKLQQRRRALFVAGIGNPSTQIFTLLGLRNRGVITQGQFVAELPWIRHDTEAS